MQSRERDSPPAPRDGLIVPLLSMTEEYLGDDPVAEEYQDQRAEELGEGISSVCPNLVPE